MPAPTPLLATLAIVSFAGNSLLCRAALGAGAIDAASFTAVRLAAGAVVLAALAARAPAPVAAPGARVLGGRWLAAAALCAYAVAFSYAYLRLAAGIGALVLFGTVQATMLGAALVGGERPRAAEWLGLGIALCGLVVLTRPGRAAPDTAGAALMVVAGVAWAGYTLLGRGRGRPLDTTAGNFVRALPVAAALGAAAVVGGAGHASARGLGLAAASGAITSGLGYALWYAALAGLTTTRAAIVQLGAPALAAAGGVLLLGEPATTRLVAGGATILGGIAVAVLGRRR